MADINPALVHKTFNVPERQPELDLQHHRKTDDVGAGFVVVERVMFDHAETLRDYLVRQNSGSSDSAASPQGE